MADQVVSNPVLEKAREHLSSAALRKFSVEEWGIDIHYRERISVRQRESIFTLPDGRNSGAFQSMARTVMLLALDEKGMRLFTDLDMHSLLYEVDSVVVGVVGAKLLAGTGQDKSPDQQVGEQKNA